MLSLPPRVTFNYLELAYASETVYTNHDILCTKWVYEWNRRHQESDLMFQSGLPSKTNYIYWKFVYN